MLIRILLSTFLFTFSAITLTAQYVYKTPSGTKYHLYECRMVDNVSKKVQLKTAVTQYGLKPCKICNPPINSGLTLGTDSRNKAVGKCSKVRCSGWAKTTGRQCKRTTSLCNGYCFQHNPDNDNHSALKSQYNSKRKSTTSSYRSSTTSRCGARTKSGGYCKRKVKGGGRCYQH